MIFASVCSGIEAASVALEPIGWQPRFFAEINKQASANLKYHWPNVPNLGDMEEIDGTLYPDVDALIGGTPCQSFSLAGKRLSLSDERGNLALSFVRLSHAIQSVRKRDGKPGLIVLWENVPGVLNTTDNAFGCFLSGFVGCDIPVVSPHRSGGWPDQGMVSGPLARAAWRVLDAQYFGLAQRRERVFVVVCFGEGADPAKILFEQAGLHRHPPSRRKAREDIAAGAEGRAGIGGAADPHQHAPEITGAIVADAHPGSYSGQDAYSNRLIPEISHALNASNGGDAGKGAHERTYIPELAWALQERDYKRADSNTKDGHLIVEPIAFRTSPNYGAWETGDRTDALNTATDKTAHLVLEPIPILEAGARTGREGFEGKDGCGVGESGDPMFTLQSSKQHAVATTIGFSAKDHGQDAGDDIAPTLRAMGHDETHPNGGGQIAVAFKPSHFTRGKDGAPSDVHPPLSADADKGDQEPLVLHRFAVRRLMPVECERLQGFKDGHTLIPEGNKQTADSARYRQLGNSMAVPVISWIGKRIQAEVERVNNAKDA